MTNKLRNPLERQESKMHVPASVRRRLATRLWKPQGPISYVVAFVLVFLLWCGALWIQHPHCSDLRCWAELGEAFGTLGCLFSGLAFAGLVINIRLQRIDIRQQQMHFNLEQKASSRQQLERMSLDLYSEWHLMQDQREKFYAAVESLRKANKLLSWRVLEGKEPMVNEFERQALFSLIHFFEKWAVLKKYQRLDHELLLGLIGSYLKEAQNLLVEPLLRKQEINNHEWASIQLISSELLSDPNLKIPTIRSDKA